MKRCSDQHAEICLRPARVRGKGATPTGLVVTGSHPGIGAGGASFPLMRDALLAGDAVLQLYWTQSRILLAFFVTGFFV